MRILKISVLIVIFACISAIPGARGSTGASQIRLAVVPFKNLTGDPDKSWLGEGIAETLTTRLGSVGDLILTERSQLAEAMRELELSQTGLAEEAEIIRTGKILSSQYLIIGSFQIAASQVLINARMIEVETSNTLKTAMVRGKFDNIFDLQDELALEALKWLKGDQGINKIILPLPSSPTSVETFEYLSRARKDLYDGRMDEAQKWAFKAIESDPQSADAYRIAGRVHKERGNFNEALELYRKALEIYRKEKNDKDYAFTLILVGNIHERQNRYELALKFYNDSILISRKLDDRASLAKAYLGIGNVNGMQGIYDVSLDYFGRALEIQRELGNDFEIATILNNIGLVKLYQGRYDEALGYLEESLEISRRIGKKSGQTLALINLGLLNRRKGDCKSAIRRLDEAASIAREIDNKYYLAFALNIKGDCYLDMNKPEKAREVWEEALIILETSGVNQTAEEVRAKLKALK